MTINPTVAPANQSCFSHDTDKTLKAWEKCQRVPKLERDRHPWWTLERFGSRSRVCRPRLAEDFMWDPRKQIVWREAPFIIWHPKLPPKFSLKPWDFFFFSVVWKGHQSKLQEWLPINEKSMVHCIHAFLPPCLILEFQALSISLG